MAKSFKMAKKNKSLKDSSKSIWKENNINMKRYLIKTLCLSILKLNKLIVKFRKNTPNL